jgi:nitrate reductase alpha subunit
LGDCFLWDVFVNMTESSPKMWATFFPRKKVKKITGWATLLQALFTSSSGRPGRRQNTNVAYF